MTRYVTLLSPAVNRVYREATPDLAAAELELIAPWAGEITPTRLGTCDALAYESDDFNAHAIGTLTSGLVTFEASGDNLRVVETTSSDVLDDDILTIPKYQGKTNEAFTRLLLNVTLSQVTRTGSFDILDPMAGRGTTLFAAWVAGHHAYGIETQTASFDALAAFIKTYLRTKRIKHSAQVTPLRREGKKRGQRLTVQARLGEASGDRAANPDLPTLEMEVLTGDARESRELFGKRTFDAIVTDAPYGVVHGSRRTPDARERSPRDLLADAIPVWADQLRHGGALGISWNTISVSRDVIATMMSQTGLDVRSGGAWDRFSHRVDQAITRDIIVGYRR